MATGGAAGTGAGGTIRSGAGTDKGAGMSNAGACPDGYGEVTSAGGAGAAAGEISFGLDETAGGADSETGSVVRLSDSGWTEGGVVVDDGQDERATAAVARSGKSV